MNSPFKPGNLREGATVCAPARRKQRARKALVLADNIGVFLAIARSLGRAGIAVDVATSELGYAGLSSRFVAQVHSMPSYLSDLEGWLSALGRLVETEGYSLIIPTSDASLDVLSRAGDHVARDLLALPGEEALRIFSDKRATRRLAASLGIPIARGESADSLAAWKREHEPRFPLVVKPAASYAHGSGSAKAPVSIVRDEAELDRCANGLGERAVIVEDYLPGTGIGVSVLARHGAIELVWQHRRLASTNETGRSSVRLGEPPSPALLEDVTRMAAVTGLNGVAMFEFRMDERAGDYILVEVNPRFWGSLPLAVAAGYDFPLALWAMHTGERFEGAAPPPVRGVRQINLDGEIDRLSEEGRGLIGQLRKVARTLWLYAAAIVRPEMFDSWASDDPGPHREEVRRAFSRLVGAAGRRLRS